jgi:hypothetical protein
LYYVTDSETPNHAFTPKYFFETFSYSSSYPSFYIFNITII